MKSLKYLLLGFVIAGCSNTPEFETGEIKTFRLFKKAVSQNRNKKYFIDARKLLTRQQIDSANIPILFVELETGQNGTLTPYPGEGIGQTWLGADGATVTLEKGVLIASRGMGDDLMGAKTSRPPWSSIDVLTIYHKKFSYLSGNNLSYTLNFSCKIKTFSEKETIKIWGTAFIVKKYEETCHNQKKTIKNTFFIDKEGIVRRSHQYHSQTLGYIYTERLERL